MMSCRLIRLAEKCGGVPAPALQSRKAVLPTQGICLVLKVSKDSKQNQDGSPR
ncbi:hypothetical protein NDU88_005141 [Pleurodeles waltl]|uniref:Uncharacterized protein n=1 Tax=Pleurodeles waltl TaxID=8319 RepID=A0AAV7PF32_PLEWA|nr:hypothetical protein NDU88_005141 [Pleurodeles waltl]